MLPDATQPLDALDARIAFDAIFDASTDDALIVDFLTTMSSRPASAIEIATAAQALRDRMLAVAAPAGAIDVCGTGGDGSHSLNVSTAVAIVVAACGVPVAKHGNRAASSRSGAADTLEALGLDLARASRLAEASLADLGIAFLFAQTHHPALARLAPIRRAVGRRTIFNLIGPLANPARVTRQLIGIADPALLDAYVDAIALLSCESAMVVSGDEPLDELSVAGPSTIKRTGLVAERIDPGIAGLPSHLPDDLRGGDAAYNAAALRALLDGEASAYRDAVLFNASGALIVAGRTDDWREGAAIAAEAIDRGAARNLLTTWIAYR